MRPSGGMYRIKRELSSNYRPDSFGLTNMYWEENGTFIFSFCFHRANVRQGGRNAEWASVVKPYAARLTGATTGSIQRRREPTGRATR